MSRHHLVDLLRRGRIRSEGGALFAVLFLSAAIPLPAQQAARLAELPTAAELAAELRRIPLHELRRSADGLAEIWARGPGYKASFHDGFAFYPRLGADYPRSLPFHWRTRSIASGGKELLGAGVRPTIRYSDWRCELDHGAVVETYLLRDDGVEQTFVFAHRPAGGGDLVVTGEVMTELRAEEVHSRHGDLEFRGPDDRVLVTYGRAFAVDAAGREMEVRTRHSGGRIQLTVPAAWLEGATWPVTIDPLTSPVLIGYSPVERCSDPEVAATRLGNRDQLLMFYRQLHSAGDWDCFAMVYDSQFGNWLNIFHDMGLYDVGSCSAAFVASTRNWVLCYDDENPVGGASSIRVYTHPLGDRNHNGGRRIHVTAPAGFDLRCPDLGGTEDGSAAGGDAMALLVYEAHPRLGAPTTEVYGARINTVLHSASAPFLLAEFPVGSSGVREQPHVNQMNRGFNSSWIVAWQERIMPNGRWGVRASRIRADGSRAGTADLGPAFAGLHTTRPRVAGSDWRYVLTCGVGTDPTAQVAEKLYSRRFDWAENASQPTILATRLIASGSAQSPYINGDVAHDYTGKSHWGMVFTRRVGGLRRVEVVRLGHTGGVVEWGVVASYPNDEAYEPSITFEPNGRFPLVYATTLTPATGYRFPIYGRFLLYDPSARAGPYGLGCGSGRIDAHGTPHAGNKFFDVRLSQALPGVPAWLFASPLPAQISLGPIGMPGCFLNLNPQTTITVAVMTTDGFGNASLQIPLPDAPAFIGDLFFQWLHRQGGNPLNLRSTEGLHVEVR